MTMRRRMGFAAMLGVSVFLIGVRGQAGGTNPKGALDYYLMLPTNAGVETSRDARLAAIETQSRRHGYLRFRAGDVDTTELKLFHLADGTPLVALAHTGCCCEGRCVRDLRFLADRAGGLVDVTDKVWKGLTTADKRTAVEQRVPAKDRWMAETIADQAVYRLPPTAAAIYFQSEGRVFLRFRLVHDVFVRY